MLNNKHENAKNPRCRAEVARNFRDKEGDPRAIVRTFFEAERGDRRLLIATVVAERLGEASSCGLACEPYLKAAACCWMLASCRSASSLEQYARQLWWWCDHSGKRSLSAHTGTTTRELVDALLAREAGEKAPRTVAVTRDVLRSWFSWMYDRALILRSPMTREVLRLVRVDPMAVVRGAGVRECLTLAQARELVAWAKQVEPAAAGASVLLQASAGLRSMEVARLERRHVVVVDGAWMLTVPGKGQKVRRIRLEAVAVAALERLAVDDRRQGERGALLRPKHGGRYSARQVQAWAKTACREVGRPELSSHALRRTCATLLREAGATLEECQQHLGHANPLTTSRCYVTRRPAMTAKTGMDV